jgi:uncharacterized protein (DUF924 family)
MVTPEDILTFWFGEFESISSVSSANQASWFKKDPEFDALIKSRFEESLAQASRGELDHWLEESPAHGLALLILLDQFPRNMYRSSGQSFAYDAKARAVAEAMLQKAWEKQLSTPARMFICVALEHQEDLTAQQLSMVQADALVAEAPEEYRPFAMYFHPFPRKHAEIIEQFGRFPHRNALLGRQSTPEELEFLVNFPGF